MDAKNRWINTDALEFPGGVGGDVMGGAIVALLGVAVDPHIATTPATAGSVWVESMLAVKVWMIFDFSDFPIVVGQEERPGRVEIMVGTAFTGRRRGHGLG